jgi:hypothetical protein
LEDWKGAMCRTMNTGAGKSEGRSRTTSLGVLPPPADAPITTARVEDFIMLLEFAATAQLLDLMEQSEGPSVHGERRDREVPAAERNA